MKLFIALFVAASGIGAAPAFARYSDECIGHVAIGNQCHSVSCTVDWDGYDVCVSDFVEYPSPAQASWMCSLLASQQYQESCW